MDHTNPIFVSVRKLELKFRFLTTWNQKYTFGKWPGSEKPETEQKQQLIPKNLMYSNIMHLVKLKNDYISTS